MNEDEATPDVEVMDAGPDEPAVDEVEALRAAMGEDAQEAPPEPASAPPPAVNPRVEKAAAAERARVERRAALGKIEEAESLLAASRARAAAIEREAEAKMRRAEESLTERERARKLIEERGLEGLNELGFDYAALTAAELDRMDPVALARKAAAEVQTLRAELAERERAARAQAHERALGEAVHRDRSALVEFAEQASDISPLVASVAKAARTSPKAARVLIETADEIKDAYVARLGRLPYMHEVVAELDSALSFLQATGGSGPAPAPVQSQATRPRHQRTLGSPNATARPTAQRRELTEDELLEQQIAMLKEAQAADRGR